MAVAKKKIATRKKAVRKTAAANNEQDKSIESWIWDAACSIRGAKDAPKYKDFILPLIFTKRLCDVFDDELNRIAKEVGSRKKAFQLAKADHKLVRFYLPLVPEDPEEPVWSVIRKLADKIGEQITTYMRDIAKKIHCCKASSTALISMPPPTVSVILMMIDCPISSRPLAPSDLVLMTWNRISSARVTNT